MDKYNLALIADIIHHRSSLINGWINHCSKNNVTMFIDFSSGSWYYNELIYNANLPDKKYYGKI